MSVTVRRLAMKKMIASMALFAFFLVPAQGAFAWTYDGISSLNPFTGFGMFNRGCTKCERLKNQKCHKVKKCDKCARKITTKRCARAFNNYDY